jgi:hypothetical protein
MLTMIIIFSAVLATLTAYAIKIDYQVRDLRRKMKDLEK